MIAVDEAAILKVNVTLNPDWDGWKLLRELRVAVRLNLDDGRVCVFPRCLHKVGPPTATFTPQDVTYIDAEGNEAKYWAIVNDERFGINKKIKFPKA